MISCKDYLLIAKEIAELYNIEFEQIDCDKNHILILCTAHPKISLGQIVKVFKSITARELFKKTRFGMRSYGAVSFERMVIMLLWSSKSRYLQRFGTD